MISVFFIFEILDVKLVIKMLHRISPDECNIPPGFITGIKTQTEDWTHCQRYLSQTRGAQSERKQTPPPMRERERHRQRQTGRKKGSNELIIHEAFPSLWWQGNTLPQDMHIQHAQAHCWISNRLASSWLWQVWNCLIKILKTNTILYKMSVVLSCVKPTDMILVEVSRVLLYDF